MALALRASANASLAAALQRQSLEAPATAHRSISATHSVSLTAATSHSAPPVAAASPKNTSLRSTSLTHPSRNVNLASLSLRFTHLMAVPVRSDAASLEASEAPAGTEPLSAASATKPSPVSMAPPPVRPALAAEAAASSAPAVPPAPAAPRVPAVAEATAEDGPAGVPVEEEAVEGAIAASTAEASAPENAPEEEVQGEEEGFYEPMFELMAAAKVVPHPDKVEKGGEDAYLISDIGAGVICVADGVGGWANDGVDPALYSKELMSHLEAAVESAEVQEDLDPQTLLLRAHAATEAEGASTAVVAVFDGEESALQIANVGDSGIMVVRQGEVIFRSQPQQHYFDCPYQLGSESSDTPKDADLYAVPVQEGDTIVMGSDGLFDNVFDKDIASVVKVFGGKDEVAVQRSATALAALASKHAADPEYMSPYTLEALEQGQDLPVWEKMLGKKRQGGKLDDITVVVAQVVKAGSSSRSG